MRDAKSSSLIRRADVPKLRNVEILKVGISNFAASSTHVTRVGLGFLLQVFQNRERQRCEARSRGGEGTSEHMGTIACEVLPFSISGGCLLHCTYCTFLVDLIAAGTVLIKLEQPSAYYLRFMCEETSLGRAGLQAVAPRCCHSTSIPSRSCSRRSVLQRVGGCSSTRMHGAQNHQYM